MMEDIKRFGERLIETGDLDPVYIGLIGLNLDKEALSRWLIAYWSFYHIGVACWMTEKENKYWHWMKTAAENLVEAPIGGRWPRAAERRHFRGDKCVRAINNLSLKRPDILLSTLFSEGANSAEAIMDRIQKWPMFGPWIAFKAADMLETCANKLITFPDNLGLIYKEPSEALDILSIESRIESKRDIWDGLRKHFSQFSAPPAYQRPCGVQEVETICCKWKSYRHGGYWIGKDIHEQRKALMGWGDLAQNMLKLYPTPICKPEAI